MKKNHSLSFLAQSMLAALLVISSALADVGGHLMVEASGIKTGSGQLDVRFTGNGEVRISWDEQSMRNAILQVSTNCVDWTEVANASSPFFTPLNNEVSTYYRVVYALSGGTTDTPAVDVPPVDFGRVGMLGATQDSGVIARGVFGVDDSPGPDLLWEDGDGDELVDEEELTALGAGHDTLKAIINNLRGVDGESVPVPIEWLEEILDRLSLAQEDGGSGPGIGMIVSVNPAFGADTFRDRLEAKAGLHDSVHCIVGGTMCSARSSNDPVFFSHHANVDKVVEGQTQDLLIALVDFPDDLSGSVSSMLHD
ncbi:MAG: tyrosinase family protein, partial [Verrucomicrobiales bacterium]|nr:tyrosinase family protein [Verrucomicrobiales bacterium]